MENDWERIECNVTTCPRSSDTQQLAINASQGLQETFGDTNGTLIGGSFRESGTSYVCSLCSSGTVNKPCKCSVHSVDYSLKYHPRILFQWTIYLYIWGGSTKWRKYMKW